MDTQLTHSTMKEAPVQKPNLTGIPTQMKLDFERRSGLSFDDVRVHYNSDKPARLGALAYTQGNQIHVGPGQEQSLPHELGHVVQQKLGMVRPTAMVHGELISENPALEHSADIVTIPQAKDCLSPAHKTNAVIQRKGAVSLADLLRINGYSLEALPHLIQKTISQYDELPQNNSEFEDQLHLLDIIKNRINELQEMERLDPNFLTWFSQWRLVNRSQPKFDPWPEFDTLIKVITGIIENEIVVVKKQRIMYDPDQDPANSKDNEYSKVLTALEHEQKRIRALSFKEYEPNSPEPENWIKHHFAILRNIEAYKMLLKHIQAPRTDPFNPQRQENPYAVMGRGHEWTKPPYLPFLSLSKVPEDKIPLLSAANTQSIQQTIIIQGEEVRNFSDIDKYNDFCGKIETLLLEETQLAHYSFNPQIPMLLSTDYAQAAQISLTAENSALGKERALANTGFVFFFLENKHSPPRSNARFGTARYTISTKHAATHGILSRSWLMLADFQTAYSNFKKTYEHPKGREISRDKQLTMIFDKENSLEGTMTYLPSNITLKFEPFHNILAGDQMIPNLARFAAQQIYALHNVNRDLNMTFERLLNLDNDEILSMTLKMFQLQIMVPFAVVPLSRDIANPSAPSSQSPQNAPPKED